MWNYLICKTVLLTILKKKKIKNNNNNKNRFNHTAHNFLNQKIVLIVPVGYGPDDWEEVSSHCSETAQSPINIDTSSVQKKANPNGLSFTADNKDGGVSGTLTNNGHAPTLKIDKPKGTASLTGGPLGDSVYELEQLHFHFGCDDDEGSEHTVDKMKYTNVFKLALTKDSFISVSN